MSPRALAGLIAQAALAQLKVAVDQRVALTVDTAELIAIAIGNGAAQQIANIEAESEESTVVQVVETPEVRELLSRSRHERRPIMKR